jgi:hypothetical protein
MSTTAADIATWMTDIITTERRVTQTDMNDNGHPSIDRAVLKEFRKAHRGAVKWDREDRAWYVEDAPTAEPSDE